MVVYKEVLRAELVAGLIGVAVACEYGAGLRQRTSNCGLGDHFSTERGRRRRSL